MSSWQVQHGQGVYSVEVKMDKPTIESIARKLDPHFPAQELTDEERAEACQALLDYAGLRRKWDAVVNAEPVAYKVREELTASLSEAYELSAYISNHKDIYPLIRKPE